jgi:hypothetical protein
MTTPANLLDQTYTDLHAGRIDRRTAIDAIRAAVNVTEAGAADMLDASERPGARYSGAVTERTTTP